MTLKKGKEEFEQDTCCRKYQTLSCLVDRDEGEGIIAGLNI